LLMRVPVGRGRASGLALAAHLAFANRARDQRSTLADGRVTPEMVHLASVWHSVRLVKKADDVSCTHAHLREEH
jgi:hypothetical protein